jgi:hypothetical protein
MAGDKRSTSVVIALVVCVTLGAVVLRALELRLVPGKPNFEGSTLLMAEQPMRVQDVEIAYVSAPASGAALALDAEGQESVCVIDSDGSPRWEQRGPRVRLVVVGTDSETLGQEQKATLMRALGTLSAASGQEVVPVRLALDSDVLRVSGLPAQATDLRNYLERKGIIK